MYQLLLASRILPLFYLLLFPISGEAQPKSLWASPIKECWAYPTGKLTKLGFASDNESTILLPYFNGTIDAIEFNKGSKLWSLNLGGEFNSPLIVNNESLYVANLAKTSSKTHTSIVSVDIKSGVSNWKIKLDRQHTTPADIQLALSAKTLFIVNNNGTLAAIDRITTKTLWINKLDIHISSNLSLTEEHLVIGTSRKTIVFISKKNGAIHSQVPIEGIPTSIFTGLRKYLFVGDKQGNVSQFNSKNAKRQWSVKTGGEIVGFASLNEKILVLSNDNFVYMISPGNGRKVWKRKLAGRIVGKTILDDRVAVFLSSGSNVAVFIDLKSGAIVNRLIIKNDVHFVASPILIRNTLLIPTNEGLKAYSSRPCR